MGEKNQEGKIVQKANYLGLRHVIYLEESLNSTLSYVQIGSAQMGPLVHRGGRVYQKQNHRHRVAFMTPSACHC